MSCHWNKFLVTMLKKVTIGYFGGVLTDANFLRKLLGILRQFECHVVLLVNHMNKSRGVIIAKNVDTYTHSCLKPVNHCPNLGVKVVMKYTIDQYVLLCYNREDI